MSNLSRRKWLKRSLLASSAIVMGGSMQALPKLASFDQAEDGVLARLNWNENPYGPSKKAKEAIMKVLENSNRYPDQKVEDLRNRIASNHDLQRQNVMITAGSTEVLSLLGQHVGLIKGEILIPWPSFPTIVLFGQACGATIKKVDLNKKDQIDLDQITAAISDQTTLIFICNPNNPTSTELDSKELKDFCRRVPSSILICIDEAYIEYSKKGIASSMASLVAELPNLVICRTFSKAYGLAGLRIGYAISSEQNIMELQKRHLGWGLSAGIAPLEGAMASLEDQEFIDFCVEKNEEGRQILYTSFDQWNVSYADSSTNFVYVKSKHFHSQVVSKMKEANILITKWPDMKDHIRISIGTPDEMTRFVNNIEKFRV